MLNRAIEISLAWLEDGDGLVFVVVGRVVVVAAVSVNVHTDHLLYVITFHEEVCFFVKPPILHRAVPWFH